MNNFKAIIAAVWIVGLSSFTTSCQGEQPGLAKNAPCCEADSPAALHRDRLPGSSLYLLESEWVDQTGAARSLEGFRDKLVVAAMIFTSCEYACPRIMEDLKAIEAELPGTAREQVQFVLVSMDTERDTPAVLAAYAKSHKLDTKRWTLIRGDSFAVRGIAAGLGVRYKRDINGNFSHSNLISLLDQDGVLTHQLEGLGADTSQSVNAILANLPQ